jgi:2-polyprenyl-3-methyl-5-hydroxy-6-metoxy-1,4-benzoquinol methylase
MSNVVAREREKYESMWSVPSYAHASPGAMMLPVFLDMANGVRVAHSVLDAGCGSGKGAVALAGAGFEVTLCDLTDAGLVDAARAFPFHQTALWDDLSSIARTADDRFDYVYCCDVLEHIPPTFAMLVIRRLLDVSRLGVFLSISTVPDTFGSWIGEPLHQTVQSFVMWRDQLNTVGRVIEARDLLLAGCYLVHPND